MAGKAPRTLVCGGKIHARGNPDAMVIEDGHVAYLGADPPDIDDFDEIIRLDGALLTPAFVDAHVHTTSTGLALSGLDLTGCASRTEMLEKVAAHAREHPGEPVIGHGWEIPDPPTADELDRASGGLDVYLSRIDVHSGLVSAALLGRLGMTGTGLLAKEDHGTARRAANSLITPAQRERAQRLALRRAASRGVGLIHELGGPEISSVEDMRALAGIEEGPDVITYWGELGGVDRALELKARGAAGDIFADGSLGSHTAHLRANYADADHNGHAYLTAAQIRDHVIACSRAGIQAGFHAIGDGGVETVVAGFEEAAAQIGTSLIRRQRHRIEHVELADFPLISRISQLGLFASVQPAFDAAWGGEDGMYAARLGPSRAAALNPYATIYGSGISLAFGSDSPVTPIDPWGAIRAAAFHHNPHHRLPVQIGFTAHTLGGWQAAGLEGGRLQVGGPATFAVWDIPNFPDLTPDQPLPVCLRTAVRGETIYGGPDQGT